ncbi:MAG: hypothetical protein LQ342_007811 [Letrouitia transgressa]|nr:MAG: hypothetical protein LQ342_007811 [Letrouitia transgressa]
MSKQPQYDSSAAKGKMPRENEPRLVWTEVDHHRKSNNRKPEHGGAYSRPQFTSPAARSRQSVYSGGGKSQSHYKQSCLPVDERDPVVLGIEEGKGQRMSKDWFRAGIIIRAVLHEQDYIAACGKGDLTLDADRYRTSTPFGSIYSKQRKMIVLALYEDHYIAIPLFTHNGTGLVNKRNPDEFVSVQDHRRPGEFKRLSTNKPLVTESINDGIDLFDPLSTAHVTYGLPRKYDLPITHEGTLRASSLNTLIKLYNDYAPRQKK